MSSGRRRRPVAVRDFRVVGDPVGAETASDNADPMEGPPHRTRDSWRGRRHLRRLLTVDFRRKFTEANKDT
jgi:hypothetical protein